MDKVVVTKSKLDSLAQHINTKAGTTGAKTIAQMQETVDGIAVAGANHIRYTHNNPAAVSGSGNYITVVSGDETLKRVRSLDTLLVVCRMTGTVSCVKSCLGTNANDTYPIHNPEYNGCQSVLRLKADGGVSANNTVNAVDDNTNIAVGSGRIYITPEGDLRIYSNTNGYPILAGKVIVDVMW